MRKVGRIGFFLLTLKISCGPIVGVEEELPLLPLPKRDTPIVDTL